MRNLAALLLAALVAGSPPAGAETARTIGWADLLPAAAPLADPLGEVPMSVRYDLGFAAQVMADAEAGLISKRGPEYAMAVSVLDGLRVRGFDADRLVAAVADRDAAIGQRREALNTGLDGALVRLPGFALPLADDAGGVREFLLVPWLGACIHTPPPPPNQTVHAQLSRPHRFERRFEEVWITGRLSARPSSRTLSYVDGQAPVATGYAIDVVEVQPLAADAPVPRHGTSFSADAPPGAVAGAPSRLDFSQGGRAQRLRSYVEKLLPSATSRSISGAGSQTSP